jgi:cytochrome c peroxidase
MKLLLVIGFLTMIFLSHEFVLQKDDINIPKGFPQIDYPEDNLPSQARIELGKKLFFDEIMSRDRSLSCSSCHIPELAFTDGSPKSIGKNGELLLRNSPTLTNIAYHTKGLLMDAGVPTLEMQILVPVQEHQEFDFHLGLIAERMKTDSNYVELCQKAYGSEPNQFVITRALACYERTLISGNSRYDQYKNGNKKALSESEIRGMNLFFDRLNCTNCHSGFNFTNLSVKNNGLYPYPYPLDSGRMRITNKEIDRDKFKVPTLRNIELTDPYMHDGSIATLEEVIDHYKSGGQPHVNKDSSIVKFELTESEKTDLVLFLKSLTDRGFINSHKTKE